MSFICVSKGIPEFVWVKVCMSKCTFDEPRRIIISIDHNSMRLIPASSSSLFFSQLCEIHSYLYVGILIYIGIMNETHTLKACAYLLLLLRSLCFNMGQNRSNPLNMKNETGNSLVDVPSIHIISSINFEIDKIIHCPLRCLLPSKRKTEKKW